jgi:ribose-phosphate pyrophosphokinase
MYGKIKIFAASANRRLAKSVCDHLMLPLGDSCTSRFADGEINMRVNETVRGDDIFIIQSTAPPVNETLMELLIMIDAMRRSSAGRITAVIPYFGYARQDRRARSHDPISARLVADMIITAGANRVLSMDLHCPQIQGFFNIPMDHLKGIFRFANYYKKRFDDLSQIVVVSPDFGSVARCNAFAALLDVPLAIVDKRRSSDTKSEIANFIGEVEGKYAVLLDDVISTAGSLTNAAKSVMEHGAKGVFACVTHPILCGDAMKNIDESPLKEILVLDTIELPPEKANNPKINVLSISKTVAHAIDCIHNHRSIGELFKQGGTLGFMHP